PAMAKAREELRRAGESAKSSQPAIVKWLTASPAPRTQTGGLARSRARSAPTTTTAPPPSERMQQSSACRGDATIGEARTSATVIGSRKLASGFRAAL